MTEVMTVFMVDIYVYIKALPIVTLSYNCLQAKDDLSTAREKLQEMERELKKLNNEKREAETDALMAKSQLTTFKQTVEQNLEEQQKYESQPCGYIYHCK